MCRLYASALNVLCYICSGAAIALILANYCLPAFIIFFVWVRKLHRKTWDGGCGLAFSLNV